MNPVSCTKIYSVLSVCVLYPLNSFADEARFTDVPPVIDGIASEALWDRAHWYNIDVPTIGGMPSPEDFSGRYKLTWSYDALFLLAEIQDDVLFDQHADPLIGYWSDDCLMKLMINSSILAPSCLHSINQLDYLDKYTYLELV